jgi:hypothetical protein
MAMMWVTHADLTIACFESKDRYTFWRPGGARLHGRGLGMKVGRWVTKSYFRPVKQRPVVSGID